MNAATSKAPPPPPRPEPAWEIAKLFPAQGSWSVADYLALNGNYLIEFSSGHIEVLTMPTELHQLIVAYLYGLLSAFTQKNNLGKALFAPLRIQLTPGKYREPDVVFMLARNAQRRRNDFWEGADLVIEVVSDDDRRRDLETKRFEYAAAGIPEYWIVDPQQSQITVLKLAGDRYDFHGSFTAGQLATSSLLPGFEVDVTATFSVK
jgi:Uma2 family endonuclease